MKRLFSALVTLRDGALGLSMALVVGLTGLLALHAVLAALGVVAWPELALSFGGTPVPNAGLWAEIGLLALMVILCLYLPANTRMARLERSHRRFELGMEDVVRAYRIAHAADRQGVFALSTEFDSIRQRMDHVRAHPDLAHLEPELLQIAAQMSHESRDLARIYSDEKVDRARRFLRQRQEEVQAMAERIGVAQALCSELRRWLTDIEAEERQAQLQLRRLEADLREILPALGYDIEEPSRDGNIVSLPKPAK